MADRYEEYLARISPQAPTGEPDRYTQYLEGNPVIEEKEHPEITIPDRLIAKQATSPDQAIRSLQANHPNLEFKAHSNRVLIRSPGQTKWNTLDPQTGIDIKNPIELGMDIVDVVPDIAQGALEAGAVAGGAAVGGIPGAIAAGAGAGAGLEALKQKAFFPQDELNTDALLYSAIAGGASPVLFGSGVATKAINQRNVLTAIKEKGLVGAGLSSIGETVVPKFASMMSGNKISAEEFKYAAKNPEIIKKVVEEPLQEVGALNTLIKDGLNSERERLWNKLLVYAGKTKEKVDVTNVIHPLLAKRFDAAKTAIRLPGDASKKVVDEYSSVIKNLFGDEPVSIMTAKDAHITKGHIQDAIARVMNPTDTTSGEVKRALMDTKTALDAAIDTTFKAKGKTKYKKANSDYSNFVKLQTHLQSKFGKPGTNAFTAAEKILRYMEKDKAAIPIRDKIMEQADQTLGTSLTQMAERMSAARKLANAAKMPMGIPGSVSVLGGLTYAASPDDAAWSRPALMMGGLAAISPWAFKQYLQKGYAAKAAADKVLGSNFRKQAELQSAWNMLSNRGQNGSDRN